MNEDTIKKVITSMYLKGYTLSKNLGKDTTANPDVLREKEPKKTIIRMFHRRWTKTEDGVGVRIYMPFGEYDTEFLKRIVALRSAVLITNIPNDLTHPTITTNQIAKYLTAQEIAHYKKHTDALLCKYLRFQDVTSQTDEMHMTTTYTITIRDTLNGTRESLALKVSDQFKATKQNPTSYKWIPTTP